MTDLWLPETARPRPKVKLEDLMKRALDARSRGVPSPEKPNRRTLRRLGERGHGFGLGKEASSVRTRRRGKER